MGVDAEMMVTTTAELTDREVLRLAYETGAAFGPGRFWIMDGTHAVTRDDRAYYALDPTPAAGSTRLAVNLSTRYYGEGYERGDLPLILSVARWMRSKLPDCTVYYDGDTGDTLRALTSAREDQLWAHFVEHQGLPYRSYMGSSDDGIPTPRCGRCDEDMLRSGFGGGFGSYYCPGCGHRLETRDGGRSFAEPERGRR